MLFKTVFLEALVAAVAVNAQVEDVHKSKTSHTPLAACPGRSKVYEALSHYSAPAAFCSSWMKSKATTVTVTSTPIGAAPSVTVISTKTSFATTTMTPTSTSTVLYPQCTKAKQRRDADGAIERRANSKQNVPSPLNHFGKQALSSACECMSFPAATQTATVIGHTSNASAATTHVTSIYTSTVTVTGSVPTTTVNNFIIKATMANSTFNGNYLQVPGGNNDPADFSASSASAASVFQVVNGELIELESGNSALQYANQDAGNTCEFVYFNDQAYLNSTTPTPQTLDCCVDSNNELSCTNAAGATQFSVGPSGGLYFCVPDETSQFYALTTVDLKVFAA